MKTLEESPRRKIRPLFVPNSDADAGGYLMLGRDVIFHEVASTIDGYDDLNAAFDRIEDVSLPMYRDDWIVARAAASVVDDGKAMREAIADVLKAEAEAETARAAGLVQHQASLTLSNRATAWVTQNETAICSGLEARLKDRFEEIRTLASGDLRNVRRAEDLITHPEAAESFTKFIQASSEVMTLLVTLRTIVGLGARGATASQSDPTVWPAAELVANYETVWPKFYLRESLPIQDSYNGQFHGTIPAVERPWPDGGAEMLRFFADAGAELWAPTRARYRARLVSLDKLCEERRTELNVREVKKALSGGAR